MMSFGARSQKGGFIYLCVLCVCVRATVNTIFVYIHAHTLVRAHTFGTPNVLAFGSFD